MDILKNPIVIGILSGIITYGVLYYRAQNDKNSEIEQKRVSILTPLIVAVIGWFLSSCVFDSCCEEKSININTPKLSSANNKLNTKSYELVGKNNIKIPTKDAFKDVFIDIAKF